jgi:hypothetical protein
MHILVARGETTLDISCFFLLPNIVIMPKVAGTLRHRYLECRVASKVFNRSHPNIALYGYSMSMTSNIMYSVQGFLGVPNEMGNVITPTWLILLPLKP